VSGSGRGSLLRLTAISASAGVASSAPAACPCHAERRLMRNWSPNWLTVASSGTASLHHAPAGVPG
jgi:hypothetical protein